MDWTLLLGLATALCGSAGLGGLAGALLTRRTEHEKVEVQHAQVAVSADEVQIKAQVAERDYMAQVVKSWEELMAPYREELGHQRDAIRDLKAAIARCEEKHNEAQALIAALTAELTRERRLRQSLT